jgi:hypothetical protein
VCSGTSHGTSATTITVDGAATGRVFDYIGGLSGGGGTSRLLYDYPAQQQSEILDYLFKPGFGASLQLLKVEIGGDEDTTNGAEASHERTQGHPNYHLGYEWWLMQQAKARNPNIKLFGLEWSTPGWVGNPFNTEYNPPYVVEWIQNAQSVYGLTIDYVGGWNEMGYYGPAFEALKTALTAAGLHTKIVAADEVDSWSVAQYLNSANADYQQAFAASVDVIGSHYVCGYQSDGSQCGAADYLSDALATGKPLWASEEGSLPYNTGAIPMARATNRHYIQGKITGSINWSLVGSWYTNLPFGGVDGLLYANQPWSGNYVVDKEIWTTAHTTQFVAPGWQYLDTGSSVVANVGSYVALKAPNGEDWSVVLETMDATSATTFTFVETGGVFEGPVHVWASNLNSTNSSAWFVEQPDITPTGCTFSFTAQPMYVYSFTSTTGQGKGATTPPASATLAIPYSDNFESYTVGAMPNIPKYFSTVEGAFEVESCVGGRTGKCLQQEVTAAPAIWTVIPAALNPVTVVGDPGWTNYQVTVDALLPQTGSVDLVGRVTGQSESGGGVEGYHLIVSSAGTWTLATQSATMVNTALATGTASFALNSWHTLALDFNGTTIKATLDGTTLTTKTDATYTTGNVALSCSQWQQAQFDNFSVTTP